MKKFACAVAFLWLVPVSAVSLGDFAGLRENYQAALTRVARPVPAEFKPFVSEKFEGRDDPIAVEVDVSGLDDLCLVAKGPMGGGHAVWGEPTLITRGGQRVPLTKLSPGVVVTGWSSLKVDKGEGKYHIGRKRMSFGVWAHVDSYLSYPLDKKYVKFEAKVGLASSAPKKGAHAVFQVLGGFSPEMLKAIQRNSNQEILLDILKPWNQTYPDVMDLSAWIKKPGNGIIAGALRGLLAKCGREDALATKLADLEKTKPGGGEPEWIAFFDEVLAMREKYRTLDDAVERLSNVIGFMAEEGVPTETFAAEVKRVHEEAAAERAKGAEGLAVFVEQRVSPLTRKILFSHPGLNFKDLLVDVRHLPMYYHNADQYMGKWSRACPGPMVLEDWKSGTPKVRSLLKDKLPPGATRNPSLSFDGRKILFSYCDHTETDAVKRRFFVYEAALDGSFVRQVTGTQNDPWEKTRRDGAYTVMIEDFDPCYLPDGGFVFTSTRGQSIARCHAGRNAVSYLLFRGSLDGKEIKEISWGEANELTPSVLNDGRIIYNRWEYVNRHDCHFHKLWTTRPDGTAAANFYGNLTVSPFSIVEPKAIPGSQKIMATASAHHSFSAGCILLIDPKKGLEGPEPVTRLTPEAKYPEAEGWETVTYSSPYPISEKLFFASYSSELHGHQGHAGADNNLAKNGGVNPRDVYKVYLVFNYNGKAYREPIFDPGRGVSAFSPTPVRPRPVPPVMPSMLPENPKDKTGVYYVQNVYDSVHTIEPGSIKYLRINALYNQMTPRVPHRGWIMDEVMKGVVGTVPVNEDGSVAFRIPAETSVQLQLLDAEKKCVMNMRSFIYLQPGESASCAGCHDDRMKSPPQVNYGKMKVQTPKPVPGPETLKGFRYMATVQPVWDRHCIACHGLDKTEKDVNLTGTYTERDPERYPNGKVRMSLSYDYLIRNPKFYKMLDRNRETSFSTPKDYLSAASTFPDFLKKHIKDRNLAFTVGEWERVISWLDVNGQFYGDYSFNRAENREPDPAGEKALREHVKQIFGEKIAGQPFAALVNNGETSESRILKMPLAIAAGGWNGGADARWKSKDNPDYIRMAQLVEASLKPLPFTDRNFACGHGEKCRCGACWVKEFEQNYPRK